MLERETEISVKKSKGIAHSIFINLLFAVIAGLGIYVLYALLYVVEPLNILYVQELGDLPQTDIHYYLAGPEKSLAMSTIDFSGVDFNTPGSYTITVKHGFEAYEVGYVIQDSTPPKVHVAKDLFVCETGREYSLDFFVDSVSDCSDYSVKLVNTLGNNNVLLRNDGEDIILETGGTYTLCLYAKDINGNSSSSFVNIVAESSPVILGTTEFFVAQGSSADLLCDIYAFDNEDGVIQKGFSCDFDEALFSLPGDYEYTVSVSDSDGLIATRTGTVHVYEPLLLQDKINTGKLEATAANAAGVLNAYDNGYSIEDNIEAAVEKVRPAVVSVYYEKGTSRTRGSGYILKITESDIIVATNCHVVGTEEKVNVVTYDGTVFEGTVVATSQAPDMAFIKIPIRGLGDASVSELRTMHINLGYYEELGNNPAFSLGVYCLYFDGTEWLRRYGKIVRKTGMLGEYFENFDYPVTEVSIDLIPGMSGSGIIDSHGNLICMATYYYEDKGQKENYCVSLNDILDFYEKCFGERLEYY